MSQEFPKVKCAVFVGALIGLLALSTTYSDTLFDKSHRMIKDLQANHSEDSSSVKFFETFSEWTEDHHYVLLILALSPFLSRERFWYYFVAIQFASFIKINIKMMQSEPRPVWVWSDLGSLGCSASFGSPSGHSTRAANFGFLVIFDLFFASEWSRSKYVELKQMSVRQNKVAFVLVTLACVSFWLLNLYDRVFLGKHTLNQVILGSQVGIWCAAFSQWVLRDTLFSHITKVTSKAGKLATKVEALRYSCIGAFFVCTAIATTCAVGYIMNAKGKLQQAWLVNLRDTCGQEYDIDENGLLLANANGMYKGTVVKYMGITGALGLYLGQVLFRYNGHGRLSHDAYTCKSGIYHQVVYSCLCMVLYMAPKWFQELLSTTESSQWAEAIFMIAIPQLFVGILITLYLPKTSMQLASYPVTGSEVTEECYQAHKTTDTEKGIFEKNLQINEKLLSADTSRSDDSTVLSRS